MHKKHLTVAFFLLFIIQQLFSQQIITDTIRINFRSDSLIPVNYLFKSVTDNRKVNPKLVGYSQTKKFLLLPVDQEIAAQNSIAQILKTNYPVTNTKDTFLLDIDYFLIEKFKGRFYNPYMLYANLPIKQIKNGKETYIGTLVYNYDFKPSAKRTHYPQICEGLLPEWDRQFKIDMISVANYSNNHNEIPENLLIRKNIKPYYFNVFVSSAIGFNFWQIEGEIQFTRPETSASRWIPGSFIRYQQTPDFQMIGFGKKFEHFNKRLSEKYVLDIGNNLILGLNKWKETKDIKLQQLFQLSLSSSQCVNFDRKNIPGLILKAGLFENFYYIIEKKPAWQIGPYLSAGYKF